MTTVEIELAPRPFWATTQSIHDLFGICQPVLRRLVAEGHVRSRKLGDAKQATRIYRIADLLEYLEEEGA